MVGDRPLACRLGGLRHLLDRGQRHGRAEFRSPRPSAPGGRDGGLFRPRAASADEFPRPRPHRAAAQDHDRGRLGHVRRVAVVLPRALRRAGRARRAPAGDADCQLAPRRHPARPRRRARRSHERRPAQDRSDAERRRRLFERRRRTRVRRARQHAGDSELRPRRRGDERARPDDRPDAQRPDAGPDLVGPGLGRDPLEFDAGAGVDPRHRRVD